MMMSEKKIKKPSLHSSFASHQQTIRLSMPWASWIQKHINALRAPALQKSEPKVKKVMRRRNVTFHLFIGFWLCGSLSTMLECPGI
jgi:hypothetical protein